MPVRSNIILVFLISLLILSSSRPVATAQEQSSTWSQRALPLPDGEQKQSDIGRQFRLMQQLQKLISSPSDESVSNGPDAQAPDGRQESWLNPETIREWTRTLNPDQKQALQRLSEQFESQTDDQGGTDELERQLQQFLKDRQIPEFKPSRQPTEKGSVQKKLDEIANRGQGLPPLERPNPAPRNEGGTDDLEQPTPNTVERHVKNLNQQGLERTLRDIVRETHKEVKEEAILDARRAAQAKLIEEQRTRLETASREPLNSSGQKPEGTGGFISSEMLEGLASSHRELEKMIRELQKTQIEKTETVPPRPYTKSLEPSNTEPSLSLAPDQNQNTLPVPSLTERIAETYKNLTTTARTDKSEADVEKTVVIADSAASSGSEAFPWSALVLCLLTALIALIYWKYQRVHAFDHARAAKSMYTRMVPVNISSGEDVIKAFHYLALASAAAPQHWWPHPKTAEVLAKVSPDASPAVQQLAEIYEIARYSPEGTRMTPEQLARASNAVHQILR
jgi:hypothetical protein